MFRWDDSVFLAEIENIRLSGLIEIGAEYIHQNGGRYKVIDMCIVTDPHRFIGVVYKCVTEPDAPLLVRPWDGNYGWNMPRNGSTRFTKIESS